MAMNALGPRALPACTAVLLCHALAAYDSHSLDFTTNTTSAGQIVPTGTTETQPTLVLLSRSSQRKASRRLKSSLPEEIFRLAIDMLVPANGGGVGLNSRGK